MAFEHIILECGVNIRSMEQLHETLRESWAPPSQSMDELAERLNRVMPGGYPVTDQDQAERQERRELTGRLQEKMTRVAESAFETQTEEHRMVSSGIPRHLQAIVLDIVADDKEEYSRRCAILQGNDPQAKTELTMAAVHALANMFQEVRETPLNHMTDEQIVDHFETIHTINQTVNQLFAICGDQSLALTPEQREELRQLETEFGGPVAGAYNRAKAISNPCYELFPAQQFQNLASKEIYDMAETFEDQPQFQEYLTNNVAEVKNFVSSGLLSDIVRSGLDGHAPENVLWMDETGEEIQPNPSSHLIDLDTTFIAGKPLIVCFPDGQYKIFSSSLDSGNHGVIEGDVRPVAERFKQQAAVVVKEPAKNLLNELKEADSWYINSSREFKEMRSAMEAMEKASRSLGDPLTAQQLMRMRELSRQLEQTSQAYLDYKGLEGKNDTERKRIKAAQNIQKFAKQQSARLKMVFDVEPGLEADARAQQQEEMRRKFKVLDNFLFDKQPQSAPEEKVQLQAEKMEELLQKVGESYPKQPGEPTSALNSLHSFIGLKIHDMTYGKAGGGFQKAAKQAMVLMTAYDLIAQERNGRQSPGPMEKLCSENINGFATAIAKDDEMKKKLDGFITPERFERFIKENEGRKIAGRIIEKAKAPVQQQSAQQPQPAQTLAQPNPQRPGPAAKSK